MGVRTPVFTRRLCGLILGGLLLAVAAGSAAAQATGTARGALAGVAIGAIAGDAGKGAGFVVFGRCIALDQLSP